jgi:hypothetical protein
MELLGPPGTVTRPRRRSASARANNLNEQRKR